MKTTKDIWVAKDKNTGDIFAFEKEPTLYGMGEFWISNYGYITPMRMFSSEINRYANEQQIDLTKQSIKVQLNISAD